MNVEIKADVHDRRALVRAVAAVVGRASRATEVVVSSFDPFVVAASAAAAPRVRRGMLVGRHTPRLAVALPVAMRALLFAAHVEDPLVDASRASRLARAGLRLVVWTVNDAARASELAALGAHAIITDRPGEMVRALRS